jgi:hypothetical protein
MPKPTRSEYIARCLAKKEETRVEQESRLESYRRRRNRNNQNHKSPSPTAASTMASTKKSPTKRKGAKSSAKDAQNKKQRNTNTTPSEEPATPQQQDQTTGSPPSSERDAERDARANKRAEKNPQESDQKTLGPVPRKKSGTETEASAEETTDQEENAAMTDEKVDPQDEAKDPDDDAAKPTKVPTNPRAPADTSDNKSDEANSEAMEATQPKNNNIDDDLQAEGGEKNSSSPHAVIAKNTENQSQTSDSSDEALFSSVEEAKVYFDGVDSHQDNWFQSDELPAKHRQLYEKLLTKVVAHIPSQYLRSLRVFFPHLANNVEEKDQSKKAIYHLAHLPVSMHSNTMETMKFWV